MNQAIIDQYAAGGPQLAAAIQGLSPNDFTATPIPNTWSIAQIVLHLMDSDLICSDRMKRIIAEEKPSLIGFDETAFAKNLFYEKLNPFIAADVFQKNRELTAIILRNLPATAFDRVGMHNERGPITLRDLIASTAKHSEHHLTFLHHKRQLCSGVATRRIFGATQP